MAPHHQSGRATDTRNDPTNAGPVNSAKRGTLPRRQERSLSQPRPTTTRPPPRTGQEPHDDEPSWHRLLGTLLSSQGSGAPESKLFRVGFGATALTYHQVAVSVTHDGNEVSSGPGGPIAGMPLCLLHESKSKEHLSVDTGMVSPLEAGERFGSPAPLG